MASVEGKNVCIATSSENSSETAIRRSEFSFGKMFVQLSVMKFVGDHLSARQLQLID